MALPTEVESGPRVDPVMHQRRRSPNRISPGQWRLPSNKGDLHDELPLFIPRVVRGRSSSERHPGGCSQHRHRSFSCRRKKARFSQWTVRNILGGAVRGSAFCVPSTRTGKTRMDLCSEARISARDVVVSVPRMRGLVPDFCDGSSHFLPMSTSHRRSLRLDLGHDLGLENSRRPRSALNVEEDVCSSTTTATTGHTGGPAAAAVSSRRLADEDSSWARTRISGVSCGLPTRTSPALPQGAPCR